MAWWWWWLSYYTTYRNLISVTKVSSDSFLLSESIGKDKENTPEKHMLNWEQTKEPWYLNLP